MPNPLERLTTALADRYLIERELGQGGMATVYLAEDLKHRRKVALKVLKPELAAVLGAERFVQEITTTAALQHPHILPLFDSGTADGFLFYVMPFIDGETLRAKLDRETQLGVDEAVRIAREVADALDYAHRHGVIHRDIKPENILLHDGRPMVADFGIALAVSAAAGGRMTETGLSLGTPHYMSPEQATAEKQITARSDIYSIGSVLYEMLTGNPPHVGSSAQQIIMRIVTDTPRPVREVRKSVPPNVDAAVARSLEKLPADRFESAKAFAEALGNPAYTTANTAGRPAGAWGNGTQSFKRLFIGASALAAAAIAIALWGWLRPASRGQSGSDAPAAAPLVSRVDLVLPDSIPMAFIGAASLGNGRRAFAISRDGSTLVYAGSVGGRSALYVRPFDSYDPVRLPGTEGAYGPFFSPDGNWVGFFVGNEMRKVRINGGTPVRVAEVTNSGGADWGADGHIVFTDDECTRLLRISADGGPVEVLRDGPAACWPSLLPGWRSVLYSAFDGIHVFDLATKRDTVLPVTGYDARYGAGHLFFNRGSTVFAARFDTMARRVTGPAVPVLAGVRTEVYGNSQWAVTEDGTLVYAVGRAVAENPLVWIGRDGARQPLPLAVRLRGSMEVSPDGRYLAVLEGTGEGSDLWVHDLRDFRSERITTTGAAGSPLFWSSDSRRVVYRDESLEHRGTWVKPLGGGAAERLLPAGDSVRAYSWSADERLIGVGTGRGISVDERGAGRRSMIRAERAALWGTAISPDGRFVAYTSAESGDYQTFVEPFPSTGVRRLVSGAGGAEEPRWSRDGRRLYYRSGQRIYEVSVSTAPDLTAGEPRVVYEGDFVNVGGRSYDVSPDGQRVLVIEGGVGRTPRLRMVRGWFGEVARLTRAP